VVFQGIPVSNWKQSDALTHSTQHDQRFHTLLKMGVWGLQVGVWGLQSLNGFAAVMPSNDVLLFSLIIFVSSDDYV
jgi:hypothetical protein